MSIALKNKFKKHKTAIILLLLLLFCIPFLLGAQLQLTRLSTDTTICSEKYFLKQYANSPFETAPSDIITNTDSTLIIIGSTRNLLVGELSNSILMRVSKNGEIIWAKQVDELGVQGIISATKLSDGKFATVGLFAVGTSVGFFIMKFDIDGNIIWRNNYLIPIAGERFGGIKIKEDTDGALIITTHFLENGLSFSNRLLFIKSNSAGIVQIAKSYTPPGIINYTHTNDLILKDGYSYTIGGYLQNGMKGYVMKTENATGNLIWTKYYGFNSGDAEFLRIFPYNNNRFCIVGQDDINPKDTNLFFIMDTSGVISSATYLQFNTGWPRQLGSPAMAANYDIIWAMYYYRIPNDSTTLTISRVHPENGIIYSNDYRQITGFPIIYKTVIGVDSAVYTTGIQNVFTTVPPMILGKFSQYGGFGCPPVPIDAHFGSGTTQSFNLPMTTNDKTYPPISFSYNLVNHTLATDSLCYFINNCDTIKARGPDTICNIQQPIIFTAYKNPLCINPIFWRLGNNPGASIQTINDTTVQIQFNQNWQGYVYAEIQTGCGLLKDSLLITILQSPGPVILGADSAICPNNTLQLNAHAGYVAYLWQNGSTDSTLTVTAPGIFWVQATDACNNVFRDTIVISAAPPIPFDLGPDLTKCNTDSLIVTAPPGFLNYSWSPNYNISTVAGQSVIIFPAVDTMYRVIAEKTPGCFAFDSIYVNVNNSTPIYLGADTSFCSGQSVLLNAGTGFNTYQWSNGATSQSITVNTTGIFIITATDANSCISKDTLRVLNVFNNPVITLPKDSLLCTGSSRILNAGSNMTSYLWSTGSTVNNIAVNSVGTYWVNVIDNNGCSGSDTTRITRLLSLPAMFLPADTFLCSYSSLKISPIQTYSTYLWSTGSSQQSITVSQAGIYWLRVTDNFSCSGTDSILINPKQCLEGIYVPNAFTPNKDGLNDSFRPLLFGGVTHYRFRIYNRWGQLVFESTQLGKGWDGKVSGKETDSGVFVWSCEYQFEGLTRKLEKGTVVLIR